MGIIHLKIPVDDEEFIKSYIPKFKPSVSHYRQVHIPNRLYLPAELNVKEMFDDYKLSCKEIHRKCFFYNKYWKIIKEMNISFEKARC